MGRKTALIRLSNVGDYSLVERDTTDDRLIEMWLNKGKSKNTREAYRRDTDLFKSRVPKPIQAMILPDLQEFSDSLESVFAKESSRTRTRIAVKSLFSFAMGVGYIRVNPAAMLDTPKVPNNLAARIMTEEQVLTMLSREENERNRVILRLLYEGALRVSELCGLTWANVQPNATTGGQVTVTGKGDKRRSIPISRIAYDMLLALRSDADYDEPVFTSLQGDGALTRVQVYKIVAQAAKRADIPGKVSLHWLRHAHASHALDRGTPIHLVKETLGHANIVTTNNYAHARPSESSSTYLVTATK